MGGDNDLFRSDKIVDVCHCAYLLAI